MKAWTAFYPDALPELPEVPLPVLDHHLRNACIEFFTKSKAYVVDLSAIDTVASQMAYALALPQDTAIVEIRTVKLSGNPLTLKGHSFLSQKFGDWEAEIGTPEYYTQQSLDEVMLVPAPDTSGTGALKVKAALKPSASAPGVADWIFERWRVAMAAGAKAALMAEANKPWSNPERVALYQGVFDSALDDASSAANSGFGMERPRYSGRFC